MERYCLTKRKELTKENIITNNSNIKQVINYKGKHILINSKLISNSIFLYEK